jgi:hypothetical protein
MLSLAPTAAEMMSFNPSFAFEVYSLDFRDCLEIKAHELA